MKRKRVKGILFSFVLVCLVAHLCHMEWNKSCRKHENRGINRMAS